MALPLTSYRNQSSPGAAILLGLVGKILFVFNYAPLYSQILQSFSPNCFLAFNSFGSIRASCAPPPNLRTRISLRISCRDLHLSWHDLGFGAGSSPRTDVPPRTNHRVETDRTGDKQRTFSRTVHVTTPTCLGASTATSRQTTRPTSPRRCPGNRLPVYHRAKQQTPSGATPSGGGGAVSVADGRGTPLALY